MYQTVNGVTLYYNEYGSGEKYVLSAQMGFDPDEKGWPMDLAEEGFHVFTIQIRGYGKSTHVFEDPGGEWYNIWADDVRFCAKQGDRKFLYTGQSHGAGIGWHLALRHRKCLSDSRALVGGPTQEGRGDFAGKDENHNVGRRPGSQDKDGGRGQGLLPLICQEICR